MQQADAAARARWLLLAADETDAARGPSAMAMSQVKDRRRIRRSARAVSQRVEHIPAEGATWPTSAD